MRRVQGRRAPAAITGRALVLGAVVVLLVVLLASPINRFLGSRSDVQHAATQLADDRAALTELRRQKLLWGDPGFIEEQARTRLKLAMPGDIVYQVVDKGQRSEIEKTSGQGAKRPPAPAWNTRLWNSVRAAGQ